MEQSNKPKICRFLTWEKDATNGKEDRRRRKNTNSSNPTDTLNDNIALEDVLIPA